jgi:hypothetical protein
MEEQTIQIKDLELIYSGKEIVTVPELTVYMNEKIGIIGENEINCASIDSYQRNNSDKYRFSVLCSNE